MVLSMAFGAQHVIYGMWHGSDYTKYQGTQVAYKREEFEQQEEEWYGPMLITFVILFEIGAESNQKIGKAANAQEGWETQTKCNE